MGLLPKKDKEFLDALQQLGEKTLTVSQSFRKFCYDTENQELADSIKTVEKEADQIVHAIADSLYTMTLATTSIEIEDIRELSQSIDSVIDGIENAASRIRLFKLYRLTDKSELLMFADLIEKAAAEILWGTKHLGVIKQYPDRMKLCCKNLNDLEDQGDALHHQTLERLMNTDNLSCVNILQIIKWKEVYQTLEDVLDTAEDVANVFEAVQLKMI